MDIVETLAAHGVEAERADRALREAFAKAVEEHRRAGVPLVIWRDGEVVEVSPDELSTETDSPLD